MNYIRTCSISLLCYKACTSSEYSNLLTQSLNLFFLCPDLVYYTACTMLQQLLTQWHIA